MGLTQCSHIPQLFYLKSHDTLVMVFVKIGDDNFTSERQNVQTWFEQNLERVRKAGVLPHTPGSFFYFELRISQCEDFKSFTSYFHIQNS